MSESESSCASSDSAEGLDGVTNGTTPVEFIDDTCPEEDESSKTPLNEAQMKILFGSHDPKMIFDKLDLNKNGKVIGYITLESGRISCQPSSLIFLEEVSYSKNVLLA